MSITSLTFPSKVLGSHAEHAKRAAEPSVWLCGMHWKHKTFEIEVAGKVEDGWSFLWRERCPVSTPHHSPQHGEEMRALFPSRLVRGLPPTTEELTLGPCTGRAKWTNGLYLANLNCQKLSTGTCCSRVQGYNWETTLVLIIVLRYVCPVGLWAILEKMKGVAWHLVIKVSWRGRKYLLRRMPGEFKIDGWGLRKKS